MKLDRGRASILLNHSPSRLPLERGRSKNVGWKCPLQVCAMGFRVNMPASQSAIRGTCSSSRFQVLWFRR